MPHIDIQNILHERSSAYQACIEACLECLVACEMCADACLDEQDVKMLAQCIRLDRDCAEMCATAVRAMSRGGPLAREICGLCAEACDRCAEECDRHAKMHDHFRVCADVCRRCAEECRRMAAVAA